MEVEEIADIMLRYERRSIDFLCWAVALGSNAELRTLTEAQRRRHDAILSRMAERSALMSRMLAEDEDDLIAPATWQT